MTMIEGSAIEAERSGEVRIFCVFFNNHNGTYRLTQGDLLFVDSALQQVSFQEVLKFMEKQYKVVDGRSEEDYLSEVLDRMENWKMRQAYEKAKKVKRFPVKALELLELAATRFENCGWQEGEVFEELRDLNEKAANILGFEWSDDSNTWVRKSPEGKEE